MNEGLREVLLDGEPVEYSVRESTEATEPRIDVGIHEIRVVVPAGEAVDPETLLSENAGWVLEKKRKYDRHREQAPERTFKVGERFPYLGEEWTVTMADTGRSKAEDGELRLSRQKVSDSSIRSELMALYRSEARRHLTERVDFYADRMNVEPGKMELRNQRTRWGSCSTKRTLSFNWRLMMAPPEVIDYVVVHELAHLRVEQHTRRFWTLVHEHTPDYPEHARWLDENSVRLIFDVDDL